MISPVSRLRELGIVRPALWPQTRTSQFVEALSANRESNEVTLMIEVRRTLCPVDLSDQSRHALDHAIALARWHKASITVLQVSASSPRPAYAPGVPGFAGVDFPPPLAAEVLAATARFVHAEACPDTRCRDACGRHRDRDSVASRNMHADFLVPWTSLTPR